MRSKWFTSIGTLVLTGLLTGGLLPAQYRRPALTKGVTIQQKLNSPVPLDLVFTDESGQTVPLRTYFGEKPVILSPVYFKCPSLCPMSMRETVTSLKRVPLQAGIDYKVLVVSFDPNDKPAQAVEKKAEYKKMFGRAGFDTGFHFLTGSQESISKLTSAIGFGYRWDEGTKQYIHAGGIMVATPEGKMARYFYGVDYAPSDLRMALAEASQHRISSPVELCPAVLLPLRCHAGQILARHCQHSQAGGRHHGRDARPVSSTSSCETTRSRNPPSIGRMLIMFASFGLLADLQLFPVAASKEAGSIDALYWFITIVSIVMTVLIFAAVGWFA